MQYEYKHLACGGTFDFLHKGHIGFLNYTFKKAAFVSIGLTSDKFVENMGKINVRPQRLRLGELDDFLKKNHYQKRSKIILLDDVFGSTIRDKSIEGIVATKFSETGARLINARRKKCGLPSLKILRFPIIDAGDGDPISSGRIRAGEIDRDGNNYFKAICGKNYSLPRKLRGDLAEPHGKVFNNVDDFLARIQIGGDRLVTVGDETTANFLKKGLLPRFSIIDFKIGRRQVFRNISDLGFETDQTFKVIANPPSSIRKDLMGAVYDYFAQEKKQNMVIKISGEEDLAVLPVVLLAPLGIFVCYGQPNKGLVAIEVAEGVKSEFLSLLKKFTVNHP